MKRLLFTALCICAMAVGCGYTTGSNLPSNYRTIYVEPFKNKIAYTTDNTRTLYVPLLESKVRTAVVDRYQFDGHLHIADSDKSDLVLRGDLIAYNRDELRVNDNEDVQEYRIRITVSLTLIDPVDGKIIWTEPAFAGEATYFTTGPQAKSEDAALQDALTDISRRIVDRTVQNW